MESRPFSKGDWYAYCGCKRWEDGNPDPLVADGSFDDGDGFCIIIDAMGGDLMLEEEDYEDTHILDIKFPTQIAAKVFLGGLPEHPDRQLLFDIGFDDFNKGSPQPSTKPTGAQGAAEAANGSSGETEDDPELCQGCKHEGVIPCPNAHAIGTGCYEPKEVE